MRCILVAFAAGILALALFSSIQDLTKKDQECSQKISNIKCPKGLYSIGGSNGR